MRTFGQLGLLIAVVGAMLGLAIGGVFVGLWVAAKAAMQ